MAATAFRSAAPKSGLSFTSVMGAIAGWNDRRQTRKLLNNLSRHQLEDIGLLPGDIESVVNSTLIR